MASHAINPSDPTNLYQIIHLRHKTNHKPPQMPEKALNVFESELSILIPKDADLTKINNDFLQTHHESASHVQTALRARVDILDPSSKDTASQDMIRTLALEAGSLEDATRGLELLKNWKAEHQYIDTYIATAHERYPKATAFQEKKANSDSIQS